MEVKNQPDGQPLKHENPCLVYAFCFGGVGCDPGGFGFDGGVLGSLRLTHATTSPMYLSHGF